MPKAFLALVQTGRKFDRRSRPPLGPMNTSPSSPACAKHSRCQSSSGPISFGNATVRRPARHAGLPDATVAGRRRKLITGQGVQIPDEIARTPDPIEVFTYSATVSAGLAALVEAEMASQAITGLRASPAECVLIGDATTDIQAANRAGIASIGYANRPGRQTSLTAAGATAVVTSLADLVLPIRARARPLPK